MKISEAGVKFGTSGVRGLVSELTNEVAYAFAAAFWRAAGQGARVVIGHDLRPSSPQITRACMAAMRDLGVEVIYVGALATPAVAYYASKMQAPAIVVTGSHIPFDRNGIKFYSVEGEINKAHEESISSAEVTLPDDVECPQLPDIDIGAKFAYLSRYLDCFGQNLCSGLKVAIYQHSSVARDLLSELFQSMGAEVVALGRTEQFVPIDTEAVRSEDIDQAKRWASEVGFDLLVSTDGDADRPLIADETGTFFRGDILGVLTARAVGAEAVVTPVSSNTALELSGWFDQTIRTRIGSPYVIAGMESVKDGVVAGFEANGGFLLGSDVVLNGATLSTLATRDAVLPMLAVIYLAKQSQIKASQLTAELPERYTASDRIPGIATEWSQSMLHRLNSSQLQFETLMPRSLGAICSVDQTDGYRVNFDTDTIVHLRPSGNAPELRCYVEMSSEIEATELCHQVLNMVEQLFKSEA
ncbi:MAG: phosphomannomutase [Marinobacterium sp.]